MTKMTHHRIVIGDSRKMTHLSDESIHLVITSPPYWQLKDYGNGNQIGFDDSYEDYINNLNLVWNECHRVLDKGCRLCINIGDQFARSVYYGRYKVIPIRTEIIRFCETVGFDYMGSIIWQKVTTCNTTGGASIMGSFPYPRNGIIKIDYEFILIFKKHGTPSKVGREVKEQSKLTIDEWKQYFTGHWNFPGEKQDKHSAMFPEELPKRLIKMFSFVGDTVLDPFLGSGTTTLAAKKLKRNSVGYEINESYLSLIKNKIGFDDCSMFQDAEFEVLSSTDSCTVTKDELGRLPYLFEDPVKFDKKVDPRKLKFGSRIDDSPLDEREYHSVTRVISPELVVLNNGMTVRLIGVKQKPETLDQAIRYLDEKALRKKVFMKFDKTKYDDAGNLMCYLYLRNKTFLNAHLVKNGLVDVDTSFDYRFLEKFLAKAQGNDGKKVIVNQEIIPPIKQEIERLREL